MNDGLSLAALEACQRGARALLSRQFVLPDEPEFAIVRRHREVLARQLRALGHTLIVTGDVARLIKPVRLDEARPLPLPRRSCKDTERAIDERRTLESRACVMVCLIGAVLERRPWAQVPLGELAEEVATHARALAVAVDWRGAPDRNAFDDALLWLCGVGALRLRVGRSGHFGTDAEESDTEALYDIHRGRLALLLADPIRVASAAVLADLEPDPDSRDRRLRRRLVDDPAVYVADLDDEERAYFLSPRRRDVETDAALLTGLQLERRREGSALVARDRELTDRPFPARAHHKQLALLLLGPLCERHEHLLADYREQCRRDGRTPDDDPPVTITEADLRDEVACLCHEHAEHWRWDPHESAQLEVAAHSAVGVLADLQLLTRRADGVQVRPAAFRYRAATVKVTTSDQLTLEVLA
jgi:uncharacterized protein (TIGR02678 family)